MFLPVSFVIPSEPSIVITTRIRDGGNKPWHLENSNGRVLGISIKHEAGQEWLWDALGTRK